MALTTSLPPSKQRWLAGLTLLLGLMTQVLGFAGLVKGGWPETFAAWTDVLFTNAELLLLGQPSDPPQNVYFALARLTALAFAAVAVITILLNLSRAFQVWLGRCWIGMWSYLWPQRGHAVVIGMGRIGIQLVKDIRAAERGRRSVIVLEVEDTHPRMDEARRLGALVLTGDATEQALRQRARLHLAREVFIACGDDALNVDIAADLFQDFKKERLVRPKRLRDELQCFVHTGDPEYADLFRIHNLLPANTGDVDFRIFNVREHAARYDLLLNDKHGLVYQCTPEHDEVAHYFVFGFGAMGQTTALQLGRLAHFKNLQRLRLTLIDDFEEGERPGTMSKAKRCFLDRYPGFCPARGTLNLAEHAQSSSTHKDTWSYRGVRPAHPDWRIDHEKAEQEHAVEYAVNAEFVAMPTDADAPALLQDLLDRVQPTLVPRVKPALLFCFDDDRRNVRAALRLRARLARDAPAGLYLPLYVYLPNEAGLASLLAEQQDADQFPVFVFGQDRSNAGYDQVVRVVIQKLAHAFYETWAGQVAPPYAHASPADKAFSEEAAAHAKIKLQALGKKYAPRKSAQAALKLSEEEIDMLAQMEHNRWMAERLISGWRYESYYASSPHYATLSEGEKKRVRDEMKKRKRRASLIPWSDHLDLSEKNKDREQVEALVGVLSGKKQ